MMDLDQSPISKEVSAIQAAGAADVHFTYSAVIDVNDETYVIPQLIQMDVTRNYRVNFADEITLRVLMSPRFVSHTLYPNKDNFTILVTKEPIGETDSTDAADQKIFVRRYRGILHGTGSQVLSGENPSDADPDKLDGLSFQEYTLELIDLAIEQFRVKQCGVIIRNMNALEATQGLLTYLSGTLVNLDEESSVKGVQAQIPDNETIRDTIQIPHHIYATRVPSYIQNECGGIYKGGIGLYFQNGFWYLYSEYDWNRFEQVDRTLTIINLPRRRLPGIERTYLNDRDRLIIIGTGDTNIIDTSEILQLNEGNGVRYINADRMIDDFHVDGLLDRERVTEELVLTNRRSNMEFAPLTSRRIISNPYPEFTELYKRRGTFVQVVWENANPDLIEPGMQTRYVYSVNDVIKELPAVVVDTSYTTGIVNRGATQKRFQTQVAITLFMEIPTDFNVT